MVTIDRGLKVYKAVEIVSGKPVEVGWKIGKTVQRCHQVYEENDMLLVVSFFFSNVLCLTLHEIVIIS